MKTKPASGALASEIRLRSQRLGHDHKTTAHLLRRGPDALATLDRMETIAGKPIPTGATTVTAPAARALPGVRVGIDRATTGPFSHLGEFLGAVRAAEASSQMVIDPRLRVAQFAAASGMSESVPSDGGFAVPTQLAAGIRRAMFAAGEIYRRCYRYPVDPPFNGVKLPAFDETSRASGSRLGGIRVFRADEATTATASKPTLRQVEAVMTKYIGVQYLTDELAADTPAFADLTTHAWASEIVFSIEDDILNNNGVGGPLGYLRAPALIAVPKEGGQAAATLVAANVARMAARLYSAADPAAAVFIINPELATQVFQLSFPIYAPAVGGDDDAPNGRILGRPIVFAEQAKAPGTQGDISLVDLGEYLVADRDPAYTPSLHVKFLTAEMAFRVTYRAGGLPVWNRALQPMNGTNTVSAFVTLAAR